MKAFRVTNFRQGGFVILVILTVEKNESHLCNPCFYLGLLTYYTTLLRLRLRQVQRHCRPEKSRFIRLPSIKFDHYWRKYAAVKHSLEFDGEGNAFINNISARVFHGIAKIKASFQRSGSGEMQSPQLGFVTKYLSILYDHEDRNALVTASADLSRRLHLKLLTDVKARQGELKLLTSLADSREPYEGAVRGRIQ